MLNIFTDNWDNPPVLDDHERMLRIITNNPMNELYVIVDDLVDDDEIEEEVRWALRKEYGKDGWHMYKTYEDVSDLHKPVPFGGEHEVMAYLGEFADDYDIDGIINESTWIDNKSGNRYWNHMVYKVDGVASNEFDKIVRKHEKVWKGEGWYSVDWSDGGSWTNEGPVWFGAEDDLVDEYMAAWDDASDTHLPYVEYKGDGDKPE